MPHLIKSPDTKMNSSDAVDATTQAKTRNSSTIGGAISSLLSFAQSAAQLKGKVATPSGDNATQPADPKNIKNMVTPNVAQLATKKDKKGKEFRFDTEDLQGKPRSTTKKAKSKGANDYSVKLVTPRPSDDAEDDDDDEVNDNGRETQKESNPNYRDLIYEAPFYNRPSYEQLLMMQQAHANNPYASMGNLGVQTPMRHHDGVAGSWYGMNDPYTRQYPFTPSSFGQGSQYHPYSGAYPYSPFFTNPSAMQGGRSLGKNQSQMKKNASKADNMVQNPYYSHPQSIRGQEPHAPLKEEDDVDDKDSTNSANEQDQDTTASPSKSKSKKKSGKENEATKKKKISMDSEKNNNNKRPKVETNESDYDNEAKRFKQQYYSPYSSQRGIMSMADQRNPYHPYPSQYLMHMYGFTPSNRMMSPMRQRGGFIHPGAIYSQDLRMMGGSMAMLNGQKGIQQNAAAEGEEDDDQEGIQNVDNVSRPEQKQEEEEEEDDDTPPRGKNIHRCERMLPPITLKVWSFDQMTKTEIPDFSHLVNYPCHLHRYRNLADSEREHRRCVMCGEKRLCSASAPASLTLARSHKQKQSKESANHRHIIPRQNKGLCTACDVAVWVINESGIEIKWCKGCKNFRPWAVFGDKGLATKCLRCRDRQREKYANQKEEKNKNKKSKGKGSTFISLSSPENHGLSCLLAATTHVTGNE